MLGPRWNPAPKRSFEMYCYIRTPGGISPVGGNLECVYARDDATELKEGDARYLLGKAYGKWHDHKWQIEKVNNGKCVIKGESIHIGASD